MSGFSFEFHGIDSLDIGLTRVTAWLADMTPIWDEVRSQLASSEANDFEAEGPGWADLKPSTIAKRGDDGHPILFVTGTLRDSFVEGSDIYRPQPQGMEWGSDGSTGDKGEHAAIYLQDGTENMVARPLFDRGRILEAIGTGMHIKAVELGLLFRGGT